MLFAQTVITLIKLKEAGGNYLEKETELDLSHNPETGENKYIEIYNVSYNFSNEYLLQLNNTNVFPVSGVLSFQKAKSKSSLVFYRLNTSGKHFSDIEIRFFKRGGENGQQLLNFMTYKYKIGGVKAISDGLNFTEEIDLEIGAVWIEYKPTLPNGDLGTAISYSWDFKTKAPWTP
jgi:type VI protein secretion system component Hcp